MYAFECIAMCGSPSYTASGWMTLIHTRVHGLRGQIPYLATLFIRSLKRDRTLFLVRRKICLTLLLHTEIHTPTKQMQRFTRFCSPHSTNDCANRPVVGLCPQMLPSLTAPSVISSFRTTIASHKSAFTANPANFRANKHPCDRAFLYKLLVKDTNVSGW